MVHEKWRGLSASRCARQVLRVLVVARRGSARVLTRGQCRWPGSLGAGSEWRRRDTVDLRWRRVHTTVVTGRIADFVHGHRRAASADAVHQGPDGAGRRAAARGRSGSAIRLELERARPAQRDRGAGQTGRRRAHGPAAGRGPSRTPGDRHRSQRVRGESLVERQVDRLHHGSDRAG